LVDAREKPRMTKGKTMSKSGDRTAFCKVHDSGCFDGFVDTAPMPEISGFFLDNLEASAG